MKKYLIKDLPKYIYISKDSIKKFKSMKSMIG